MKSADALERCSKSQTITSAQLDLLIRLADRRCPQYVHGTLFTSYKISNLSHSSPPNACDQHSEKYDKNCDISVISNLNIQRKFMLEALASAWLGPLIIAFYGSNKDAESFSKFIAETSTLSRRCNIVYKHVRLIKTLHSNNSESKLYPSNFLRNVGLRAVNTSFTLLLDIDFVPMPGSYERLKNTLHTLGACSAASDQQTNRTAYVISAFDSFYQSPQLALAKLPSNKSQLLQQWTTNNSLILPFHVNAFAKAHMPTNYSLWRIATEPYEVSWKPGYEPYEIGRAHV